ncbi:MAG: hypothetical protein H6599_07670 [Flavobacteriales bacterium]|nr:hypothetical protein [Flavobacteriales bacterium]
MRFRRLNSEELETLEQEFIEFLAVSGIEAHDWENFKTTNPDFCEEKICEFSDVVIGTILSQADYAEHRSKNNWILFKFNKDDISAIIIHSDQLDLTENTLNEANLEAVSISKTSKPYSPNKEDELFKMMQQGCVITDGRIFDSIDQIR